MIVIDLGVKVAAFAFWNTQRIIEAMDRAARHRRTLHCSQIAVSWIDYKARYVR